MTRLEFKDYWILGHILGASSALVVLMFKHPETCTVLGPTLCTLLGLTHYWIMHDDKVPDKC
jgi:hypothetical protein